jgi:hypothetical protein
MKREIQWPKVTRDGFLLGAGIVLTINEAVVRAGPERPYLLMLFAGMMGLPVFLRQDEKKQGPPSDKGDGA